MRIDPHTNELAATVETGEGISDLAVGPGGLWTVENSAVAARLDPRSGRVLRRVGYPDSAQALAVGKDELWASAETCRGCAQGFVTRLDLRTGTPGPPIPVGQTPVALTMGDGSLWVANFGSANLTRMAAGA